MKIKKSKLLFMAAFAAIVTWSSGFIGGECGRYVYPPGINGRWGGLPFQYYACGAWGRDYMMLFFFLDFLIWFAIVGIGYALVDRLIKKEIRATTYNNK